MTIHVIREHATATLVAEMLEEYGTLIKIAVDIERGILAGGGEMHHDCEQVLLKEGSDQLNLWGANWYPDVQQVRCEALMNIRPAQNNPSMLILDSHIRERVSQIAEQLLTQ